MQVDATASTGSQSTILKGASSNGVDMGKDTFLKLLVSQLQNQDPLEPIDDKEFLAQMAQFSTLEQMRNLSDTMETKLGDLTEVVESNLQENYNALVGISNNLVMQQKFQVMNLLGQNVTAVIQQMDGTEEVVEGIARSVAFKEGRVQMTIGDRQLYMDEITQLEMKTI